MNNILTSTRNLALDRAPFPTSPCTASLCALLVLVLLSTPSANILAGALAAQAFPDSLANSLTAYYPFDGTATDLSGNHHHGTLHDDATFSQGIIGQALSLDGVDDYVSVPSCFILNFGINNYSVILWLKTTSTEAQAVFGNGDTHYARLHDNPFGSPCDIDFMTYDGTHFFVAASARVSDGAWHHLAVTRDSNTLSLYLDGLLLDSKSGAARALTSDGDFFIGGNSPCFHGLLDELRLYNRALTQTEIAALCGPRPRVLFWDTFDSEAGGVGNVSDVVEDYTAFTKWDVVDGAVDVANVSTWLAPSAPGYGLCVSVPGLSTTHGSISTKDAITLSPGTYELAFDVAGSIVMMTPATLTARFGDLYAQECALYESQPWQTRHARVTVREQVQAHITFSCTIADFEVAGAMLDNIVVTDVSPPIPVLLCPRDMPSSVPTAAPFIVTLDAVNIGGVAGIDSAITASLVYSNGGHDLTVVGPLPSLWAETNYLRTPGDGLLYGVDCIQHWPVTNVFIEAAVLTTGWPRGHTNSMSMKITPLKSGTLYLYARTTMRDLSSPGACGFVSAPLANDSDTFTDQQGWPARRYAITVTNGCLPMDLAISGPSEVAENSLTPYRCVAHCSDGSSVDVSGRSSWTILSPASASWRFAGNSLVVEDVLNDTDITIQAAFTDGPAQVTSTYPIRIVNTVGVITGTICFTNMEGGLLSSKELIGKRIRICAFRQNMSFIGTQTDDPDRLSDVLVAETWVDNEEQLNLMSYTLSSARLEPGTIYDLGVSASGHNDWLIQPVTLSGDGRAGANAHIVFANLIDPTEEGPAPKQRYKYRLHSNTRTASEKAALEYALDMWRRTKLVEFEAANSWEDIFFQWGGLPILCEHVTSADEKPAAREQSGNISFNPLLTWCDPSDREVMFWDALNLWNVPVCPGETPQTLWWTAVHEIGHALGLKLTSSAGEEYSALAGGKQFSVMSYAGKCAWLGYADVMSLRKRQEQKDLVVRAAGPVDIVVVAPDGGVSTKQGSNVAEACRVREDSSGDDSVDDVVVVYSPVSGVYAVSVLPEPGADPAELVTLTVKTSGRETVLMLAIPLAEVPTTAFLISVDRTPPSIAVECTPGVITGADDRMVPISVQIGVVDEDASTRTVLLDVSSSDGWCTNCVEGVEVGSDDRQFLVRAAVHQGVRHYNVRYCAVDSSGNSSIASDDVVVIGRAGGVVLEGVRMDEEGFFMLRVLGEAGQSVGILSSEDLVEWSDIGGIVLANGIGEFTDMRLIAKRSRFYRAIRR